MRHRGGGKIAKIGFRRVEVSDASLRAAGIDALLPGMPAELYLRAGERTALSYLIDPFTHRMNRAMTDR